MKSNKIIKWENTSLCITEQQYNMTVYIAQGTLSAQGINIGFQEKKNGFSLLKREKVKYELS